MDAKQLLEYIIRPVLKDLDLWSEAAERLVLGTACQESACGEYIHQIEGPALGIYQMEPATHDDIWENFLKYKWSLGAIVSSWEHSDENIFFNNQRANQLIGNLYYATAMCRLQYYRAPEVIPNDLPGQAALWKLRYNTPLGRGKVEEYISNWRRFVPEGVV